MNRTRSPLLILAALVLCAAAPAVASAPRAKDATSLFDKALAKVHAESDFSKAVVLEVDGLPAGNDPVKRASDIVKWRFVFDNQKTNGGGFASATLTYKAGKGFGKVKGYEEPFLEDRRIGHAPSMTLREAVKLLKKAGFRDGFLNVTLRRPLAQKATPPLYIFGVAQGSFVAVNTKTGKVSEFN